MSMADNIRSGIERKKNLQSGEAEVRDLINTAASSALKKFIQRLDTGEVALDNPSDFVRIFGVYKEINDIEGAMDGQGKGQAILPEINMRQERVFNDLETDGTIEATEEGRISIEDLSSEEVSDLISKMDTAQNKENEEAF